MLLLPLLGGLVVALSFTLLLVTEHLSLTAATGELAAPIVAAFVASYLVLLVTEPIARRAAPGTKWGARALAGMVAVAFLLRFGAVMLPQVNVIDLPWHMKWLRELLLGHWQSLYFPGDLSSVPREWGLSVIIPKSPLFYFVAAPLALLPWNLEISVKLFACLLDVSLMVFCYALLARYAPTLGGWRAGLWAAFAYAFNPLSFRSLAYGILPTILAQWLTVASFTVLLVIASRLLDTSNFAREDKSEMAACCSASSSCWRHRWWHSLQSPSSIRWCWAYWLLHGFGSGGPSPGGWRGRLSGLLPRRGRWPSSPTTANI